MRRSSLLENLEFLSVYKAFSATEALAPCAQHPKRDPVLSWLKLCMPYYRSTHPSLSFLLYCEKTCDYFYNFI